MMKGFSSWYRTYSSITFSLTCRHFCSIGAKLSKWEIIYGLKQIIKRSALTSHWLGARSLHAINQNTLAKYSIIQIRLSGEYMYMLLKNRFFVWSDMTLTLDLKHNSRSLQTLLIKGTMWVKYGLEWSKDFS